MFQRIDTLKTCVFFSNVSSSTGLQIYMGGISILSSDFKGGSKPTGALPIGCPMELPEASSGTGGTNITKSEVASRRAAPNGGSRAVGRQDFVDKKDPHDFIFEMWEGCKDLCFDLRIEWLYMRFSFFEQGSQFHLGLVLPCVCYCFPPLKMVRMT